MNYEQLLYLYTSYEYNFTILILSKNIYIIIDNISISKKKSYLKNISNILQLLLIILLSKLVILSLIIKNFSLQIISLS